MTQDCIDSDGFRANVGIIICNDRQELLWAGRAGRKGWQFPQGGILAEETPEQAMFRELHEETGLSEPDVTVMGRTERWLRYRLPARYRRRGSKPLCVGQKQLWYLLRLQVADELVRVDISSEPEFDRWRWIDFWSPIQEVIYFKRHVYRKALTELGPLVFPAGVPPRPE